MRASAAAAGLLIDRALGEPPAPIHPVALFGKAMARAERTAYADSRRAGVAYSVVGVGGAAALGAVLCGRRARRAWSHLVVATYVAVAGKALGTAAAEVATSLRSGDLQRARDALPALVGRDPSRLGPDEIARAVVESVAENTVDAIVAPAFWAAVAGPPGALAYRAVNTLDAMVGYRSARYERFGWAAARSDDLAGWIPARLTAALVGLMRPRRARAVWRAVGEDAPAHPSPNAGVAEAAFAAALGVRLGGVNVYSGRVEHRPTLGMGRAPAHDDIERAMALSRDVCTVLAGLLAAPSAVRLADRQRAGRGRTGRRGAARRRAGR